jgi:hypothetical protein
MHPACSWDFVSFIDDNSDDNHGQNIHLCALCKAPET